MKKDSLIKGTLILAAAALVARALGLFQRIPLDYMLDHAGLTYFNTANNVYLLLLVIATGGIPSAISRMIAQRYALGQRNEAKRIYRAALTFGAVTGIVLSVLLFVFAGSYARMGDNAGAEFAIAAIAPSLILFPVIAMMRGYFQGRQIMQAGGMSQIIEQIARVMTAIGLALIVLSWGWDSRWVAAAAASGSVFGSVSAFAVMLYYAAKLRRIDRQQQDEAEIVTSTLSFKAIYKEMFSISIPIVVAAMTVQFLYNFDTSFFYRLTGEFYSSKALAEQAFSVLGNRAQSLAGIPPILAIALSTSIIPIISAAYSVRNMEEVERQTSLVLRIVVFTGVPVALVLTVAAQSATGLLFEDSLGSGIVAALLAGTVFQITMMTTNSILFGLGRARVPMRHTFIGLAAKVIGSLLLAPLLGAYGLILASTICFATISWFNLRVIRREVKFRIFGARWWNYIFTIGVAAIMGYVTERVVLDSLHQSSSKLTYLLAATSSTAVTLISYALLLVQLRVIKEQDMANMPSRLRKVFQFISRYGRIIWMRK